jgi:hypothetical protein
MLADEGLELSDLAIRTRLPVKKDGSGEALPDALKKVELGLKVGPIGKASILCMTDGKGLSLGQEGRGFGAAPVLSRVACLAQRLGVSGRRELGKIGNGDKEGVEGEGRKGRVGRALKAGIVHGEELDEIEAPGRSELAQQRKVGKLARGLAPLAPQRLDGHDNAARAALLRGIIFHGASA